MLCLMEIKFSFVVFLYIFVYLNSLRWIKKNLAAKRNKVNNMHMQKHTINGKILPNKVKLTFCSYDRPKSRFGF